MRFAVLALIVLAGCGADGAPFRPTQSGSISVGTNGVSARTNVGVTNGTVSLGLGQSISR
ncbi:hypothetical protein [Yoonia sp. 208BN28-4]|uniref:hypothetical protein n=1 Tax=Yoonia sp. 208BN28-4 TaxID=3126505 RepID=UPI00309E4981